MMRFIRKLWSNTDGGVAPIIALSLIALIAVGGISFDYAHLAAMDTELQDAADHAALAAATQLDNQADSQTRATTAAQQLITNETRFARRDSTHTAAVAVVNLTFYRAYTSASSNTLATDGTDSNFVQVTVDTRAADYALTPVVGAVFGTLNAKAVAGVSSAVCGVVPFFVCNPAEPTGNTNTQYPVGGLSPGTGVMMAQGGTQWGPGNFGFLDQLGNGANGVAAALASNSLFGTCQGTASVTTETGNVLNAVRDSLNMRFDFDPGNASACKSGPCTASANVIKDVLKATTGNKQCQSWAQATQALADVTTNLTPPRYFPRSNAALPTNVIPKTMGAPRDICHYFQNSAGNYPLCANNRMGDGNWDRAAYFRTNHPSTAWQTDPELGPNVSRYQTYLWEAEDATRLPTQTIGTTKAYGAPQCELPAVQPDPAGEDRRRITAAVVNCHSQSSSLNGKKTLKVSGYTDMFLVEPSVARTRCDGCSNFTLNGSTYVNGYGSANDIYVEIIGASGTGQGGAVPVITQRSIPHLVE